MGRLLPVVDEGELVGAHPLLSLAVVKPHLEGQGFTVKGWGWGCG